MWTMVVMMQLATISAQSIQNQNWGSGTKNGNSYGSSVNQKSKNHLSSYSAYTSFPSYQDTTKPTIGYGFIPRHPIPGYSPTPPEQGLTTQSSEEMRDFQIQRNAIPACLRYMKPYGQRFRKSSRNLGILQVNIDFMDLKKISRLTKFVDDCAEAHISGSRSAPVVHCPTICVSLYETPNIGGKFRKIANL